MKFKKLTSLLAFVLVIPFILVACGNNGCDGCKCPTQNPANLSGISGNAFRIIDASGSSFTTLTSFYLLRFAPQAEWEPIDSAEYNAMGWRFWLGNGTGTGTLYNTLSDNGFAAYSLTRDGVFPAGFRQDEWMFVGGYVGVGNSSERYRVEIISIEKYYQIVQVSGNKITVTTATMERNPFVTTRVVHASHQDDIVRRYNSDGNLINISVGTFWIEFFN
ncbi:MAG: hypothetical protein FWD89_00600 [Firmicutes bacterium]|nr:hypothetical protein [Bacillota bacterium]